MESTPRIANHPPDADSYRDTLQEVLRFGRALQARKIYLITSIAVCCLLGGLKYITATPVYEATAVVMVMKAGNDYWDPSSMNYQRMDQLPTYERLFSSDAVLKDACQRLKRSAPTIPSEWLVDFQTTSFDSWPDVIRNGLSTSMMNDTQLIELGYRSQSRDGATLVINTIVDSYLDLIDQNHKDNSAKIFELLETERRDVQSQLAAKQSELLEISRDVNTIGVGTETMVQPLVQRAISLNEALIDVQKEKLNRQATLNAIAKAIEEGQDLRQSLESLGEFPGREGMEDTLGVSSDHVKSVSLLERKLFDDQNKQRSLALYYGPEHPKLIELASSIERTRVYLEDIKQQGTRSLTPEARTHVGEKLRRVAQGQVEQAVAHERELLQKFSQAENEAVKLNDQQAKLAFVNHELDRLRKLHDTLLDRLSTIEIKQDTADVSVTVIEDPEATPGPVAPNRNKIAAMSLFFGCGFGCMIVFLLDRLEDRFRSIEELRDQLGSPVLAVVRDMPETKGQGLDAIHVHHSPSAVESEAFRTLRTSLTFSHANRNILSVTSPEPSDGKTTVIANLATSFAQAGRRTLLIDVDLRKPGLSRMFGVRGLGGVTEVLRSDESIVSMTKDRIRNTELDGLDLLPCGPKPADPSVLLETPRLEDLLAWAESEYDQVLVDCPPIMAASDASLIGRLTNGILVVVQPAKTHRRLVVRAIENLEAFDVPIIGLVANRIKSEHGDGYSGYGYGYGYGYGDDDSSTNIRVVTPIRKAA